MSGAVREIAVQEAAAWLDREDRPRLIDCREADEFALCALPGAELIPLSRFEEAEELIPDKNAPLLIYCHHGVRSQHAARYLSGKGYENVANLTGGIDAWSREVDPNVPRY